LRASFRALIKRGTTLENIIYDVAVIGCGVTGASIARKLSYYRQSVIVLEKKTDISFGVSKANSGIIHAGFHHKPETLKARLEVKGNAMYDSLHEELNFPFKRVGIIVAAFSYEEMNIVHELFEQGKSNGITNLEILNREKVLILEPKLSTDVTGGLYAPGGGIIEPYRFVFALAESAKKNGVLFLTDFEVHGASYSDGAYTIRARDNRKAMARYVINASGLNADDISKIFQAEKYSIVPRKGEEFLLDKNAPGFPNHVIFPVPVKNSKGVLVIPTVEGTMMIGPTAEQVQDKEDFATTSENLEKVFNLAMKMIPVISKKDIITSFAGLRPSIEGDDFYINLSKKRKHFIHVAGIQSPGLTAAPAIAEYVEQLLVKDGLMLLKKDTFDPYLAKSNIMNTSSKEEAASLIERNPLFGNIVCRCELVSEQEIIEAIEKGHTTLDGIKYYTRAGMGRCQGGFCTYKIMKILNRVAGIPVERITKRGGESTIVSGELST
jgi:glycerol-3-phosphate dehydrogenase